MAEAVEVDEPPAAWEEAVDEGSADLSVPEADTEPREQPQPPQPGQGQPQHGAEGESGNRRRRRRGRDRDRDRQGNDRAPQPGQGGGGQGGQGGQAQGGARGTSRDREREGQGQSDEAFVGEPVDVEGYLDLRDEGYGFLRLKGYLPSKDDVYVSVKQARQFGLRKGDYVTGASRPAARNEKNPALLRIDTVNDVDPEAARNRPRFEDLTPAVPRREAQARAGRRPHQHDGADRRPHLARSGRASAA